MRGRHRGTCPTFLVALLAAFCFTVAGAPAHAHYGLHGHVHVTDAEDKPHPGAPHHPGEDCLPGSSELPGSRTGPREQGTGPAQAGAARTAPGRLPASHNMQGSGPAPGARIATAAPPVLCLWRI
ncbi:hypothetical protein PV417_12950 [Streptomyces sp. ME19-03-3]|nr:hypothetical protein [Streptomyces sp. ME19-03-3]